MKSLIKIDHRGWIIIDRGLTLLCPRVALPSVGGSEIRHMRKNQISYRIPSPVLQFIAFGLFLVSFGACATAPIDKAKLQADKDWARAVAGAEKYQHLQGLMLQGSSSAQTATAPLLAPSQSPASGQANQPLLTAEEYRRQQIEQREEVYAKEWRLLEHDVAKRVLQRGL